MIPVTDLHDKQLFVNAELIEQVSATPDTQIVLTNGHRLYVTESPSEIAERIITYRRQCAASDGHKDPSCAGTK